MRFRRKTGVTTAQHKVDIALCKGVWGAFDEKFHVEFFHFGDKCKVEETTNHFGVIEFANARA